MVVVEISLGKETFTVGGPLSAKVVLLKRGKTVQLPAFNVGDNVTGTWQATAEGHVIERLSALAGDKEDSSVGLDDGSHIGGELWT